MINFIVCDDNKKDRIMVQNIIDKYMMKNNQDYRIHPFDDYNENFMKMIAKKDPSKIYILDIETPSRSGIDVARIIRNKDYDSVIIFLTSHEDLGTIALKGEFLFLAFINKFDNCEARLCKSIERALKVIHAKPFIKFKTGVNNYTVMLDDILYILVDTIERKCIIKTDYGEFKINKTLKSLKEMFNDNFVQTHRACLVNKKRIACYDKVQRLITFDTGEQLNIVSTRFKGELC